MLLQSLPSSAEAYAADQRHEIALAVGAVKSQWRRMGPEFDLSYAGIEGSLLWITDTAQLRVAAGAQSYIPAVLAETGQSRALTARREILPESFIGTAGDGMPTESLLYGAVTHAKARVATGASVTDALLSGGSWLSGAVGTLLSDTGRASENLASSVRPITGWVRMLEPPSCGRCVVLAGKRFKTNQGFLRHPRCDCRHIPASESIAGDLTIDPRAHFDSLDEAGQIRLMGSKDNAAAVRGHDADMTQIINAYRTKGSVTTAQVYGKTIEYTTEGTTRRGLAYKSMSQADYIRAGGVVKNGRYSALKAPRLMPESIAKIATDKVDQERLLILYGWIL